MSADIIRWGVLGPGWIAHRFAKDLALVPGTTLAAVGSRSIATATAFSELHTGGAATAYGSYEALIADESVDVVYVASPHALHFGHARLALEAGKHVLCEKPLTLDAPAAEELVRIATQSNRFLMEAMWMACHPVIRELRSRLRRGDFGTPRFLRADFGTVVDAAADNRMLNPALGGGALLDLGIYPLTFAHLMLGEAESLSAEAVLTDQGVDMDVAVAGRYPGGSVAAISASMSSWCPTDAMIATDHGRIELPRGFFFPSHATFHQDGPAGSEPDVRIDGREPIIGVGYGNEIEEVNRCLREGLLESPLVPHAQTLTLMRQMDQIRAQIGVQYAPTDLKGAHSRSEQRLLADGLA